MRHNKSLFSTVIFLLLIATTSSVLALKSDREQAIIIEANHSTFDEPKGIQTLTGNASITQGSLIIRADTITLYLVDGTLSQLEANGNPVTFRQLDEQKKEVKGESKKIFYSTEQLLLRLMGEAKLFQPNQQLNGDTIEYHTNTQVVTANKGKDNKPVKIIIQPKTPVTK